VLFCPRTREIEKENSIRRRDMKKVILLALFIAVAALVALGQSGKKRSIEEEIRQLNTRSRGIAT
jgi:hypothetical protein